MIADWLRAAPRRQPGGTGRPLDLAGVPATQATVSRDLDELGAVKSARDGAIRYVMPDQVEPGHAAAKLDRLLAEWVTEIVPAGNLLVLRTPPGSANLVANALDAAGIEEVAGTIAGDDTIFVALVDGSDVGVFAESLRQRRERR